MTNLFNLLTVNCDAPRPWGVYFQDSASPQMEALVELHDNIMFYLVIILFGVAWILVSIIRNYVYSKSPISNKYLNHGTLIELIWTITPALILILIAFPSFKLLYLMDEVTDPSLTVFVEGHQWYWSYQYPDFLGNYDEELEFDSYLVPDSDLEDGGLRILEADYNNIMMSVSAENTEQVVANPTIDLYSRGTKIMDLSYTDYFNYKDRVSPRLVFLYDSLDPSGKDLYTLFDGTSFEKCKQGGYEGFRFRKGSHNFDINAGIAKPQIVTKQFNHVKQNMNNSIFSNGRDIVTSNHPSPPDMTTLNIIRANPQYAPR